MELNKIYCMDCLDGMRELEDKSVDLVLTDPPYGTKDGKGKIVKIGNDFKNFCDEVGDWDRKMPVKYITEVARVLKDDRWGVIFTDNKKVTTIWRKLERKGLIPRNTFYIIKKDKSPSPRCNFISSVETAIVFTKGRTNQRWYGGSKGPNGSITRNFIYTTQLAAKETRLHPTQKNLDAIELLVNTLCYPRDIVLDPFIGSGTTAIACLKTQRRFIGFELEQKYVDIANKRIKPWIEQERLF